jgi:hypothetical protein
VGNIALPARVRRQNAKATIHNHNHYNKIFLKLESYKACCCDERCESVETSQTPITYEVYGFELQVALCENRGKQSLTD